MLVRNFKSLIWTGTTLWVLAIFLATYNIYPYAYFAIYLGPLFLISGITGWIIKKIKAKSNPTSFEKTFDKVKHKSDFDIILEFIFTYVPYFWTFCILFWVMMMFLTTFFMKNSTVFNLTKKYTENDSYLKDKIGSIKYYGFLIGGTISSDGSGNITFSIIGEKGNVNAKSIVRNSKVETVEYYK